MDLNPAYTSVGSLFENRPMFFIPKYQRAYAWSTESVEDFTKDLEKAFNKRKVGSPMSHFFGGVLSVEHPVAGVVRQHEYEIIDGQQRISTFTLLMSCVLTIYRALELEAKHLGDTSNESILIGRIENLSGRFIEFDQEVQRVKKSVEVLRMSKADHPFYKELIRGRNPSCSRDSHHRLLAAYQNISKAVSQMIDSSSIVSKMDDLEIIQNVMDSDFTVLHMVTKTRDDAFRLFQVLNDRGTSLTEGDLLKAKTLEMLEGFTYEQDKVEELWNDILSDPPNETANYLHWIYDSYQGKSAPQNALFDQFLDAFFPQHKIAQISQSDAKTILEQVETIQADIANCRKLIDGQWLFSAQQPVVGWDRNRLSLLMKELNHTLSIPLLLAATKLSQQAFSEIVQILERTFFRYKIISNQHATPLQKIYREESVSLRRDPSRYQISSLRTKLQTLVNLRASNQVFRGGLETLQYRESGGGSNKPLKYLLITLEYYYQWYSQGGVGIPTCLDKSRIYDFSGTSIEHIYPQKANISSANHDAQMEPLKNTLGNLTILDPGQNSTGGNDDFGTKKSIYEASSILLTREKLLSRHRGLRRLLQLIINF